MHSFLADGNERRLRSDPGPRVEVTDTIALGLEGNMRMAAEDAVKAFAPRVLERALAHLGREARPTGVQHVEQAAESLALRIEFLQVEKEERTEPADELLVDDESVKLVPVDGEVAQAGISPRIFLVDAHPDQVRHERREPLIMVPFHPNDLDLTLGVRKFPDGREEAPVVLFQTREVQVGEDVAQQDEAAEGTGPEQTLRLAGAAHVRAEVHVTDDQRVGSNNLHALNCVQR